MKKFLAVLAVFTLIAGVAFAETSLGGGFAYKAEIMKGDNIDGTDVQSGMGLVDGSLTARFSGDNWGGNLRFFAWPRKGWWQSYSAGPGGGTVYGKIWWKPIDQFRVQIGHNPDGDWDTQAIGGWGFTEGAQDFVAIDNWVVDNGALKTKLAGESDTDRDTRFDGYKEYFRIARQAGFSPKFDSIGITMSIYPADGVTINFGLPLTGGGHGDGSEALYRAMAYFNTNVGIQIGDIGKANLSFVGGEGLMENLKGNEKSAGTLYASFNLTKIENLGVDLGVKFPLPYKKNDDKTYADGTSIGLGVKYASGDFGVKFRAGLQLPGTDKGDSDKTSMLGFNVLPYISLLDGKLTAYLNTGLSFYLTKDSSDDDFTITGWFVNPYVKVPVGSLTFFAGLQLYGEAWSNEGPNAGDPLFKWAVPIGFTVGF